MRHVPYTTSAAAVATVIAGEDIATRMAISATAEDSWFGSGGDTGGGRRVNIRFSGGGGGGGGGTNGIVVDDDLDVDGDANVVRSNANEIVRPGSEIRGGDVNYNNSDGDADSDDGDEGGEENVGENDRGYRKSTATTTTTTEETERKVCDRQRATSRFFFSTFGAVSGREKWPFRRKKSKYPFKRKRKPGLSNVVEIYENTPATAAGANSVVPESVTDGGGGGGGGGGEVASGDVPVRDIADTTAAATAAVSRRVNGDSGDGGDGNADNGRRRRSSSSSSCSKIYNGCVVPDGNVVRTATTATTTTTTMRQNRRTFTSLLEDAATDDDDDDNDATGGEIDELEERVVLVARSASVSNDVALSTPPAKLRTSLDDDDDDDGEEQEDVDEHVSMLGGVKTLPSVIKTTTAAAATATTNPTVSGGSKLGEWSKSKIDLLVPSLKSFVSMTTGKLSSSKPSNLNYVRRDVSNNNYCPSIGPLKAALRRNISLNNVLSSADENELRPLDDGENGGGSSDNLTADIGATVRKLRKCNTMVTLPGPGCVGRTPAGVLHIEPLRPVNRLRVSVGSREPFPMSRMCSRCSSILSMASSSKYSINSSYGFVPVSSPSVLCKVCLNEVPLKDSWTLQHCECSYCVDCVRSYVEFEVNQGAYSISCPDAQCEKQGIILLEEIESLVSLENVEKHKRYRLNKEVEMDKSRTWCPRAGCETVCTLCSTDRCTPQSVHCPTCSMDFCSNCRAAWHADTPCKSEEVVPGVTFDSELIKCCPMCSVPIEKDEGCAQMLCKRCKHVFCWYCLASLDDDFLLRHYDKGPCKNKLGHSRASVIWHRTQVISIFAGFGILLLIASPLLLLAAPCIVCCKCRVCNSDTKLDVDDDMPDAAELQTTTDPSTDKETTTNSGADTAAVAGSTAFS